MPSDLAAKLSEPLPPEAVQPHPTKNYLSTIKTIYAVERLNQVFGIGGWTYRIKIVENDPTTAMVVMKVRLLVPAYGIDLSQYGGNNNEDRGDAYKGAVTDALSKLCGYLGIGMDVYKGNAPTKQNPERGRPARQKPTTPSPAPNPPSQPLPPAAAAPRVEQTPPPAAGPSPRQQWFALDRAERLQSFRDIERNLPPDTYYQILSDHGVDNPQQFRSGNTAWACYEKLTTAAIEFRRRQANPETHEHHLAQEGRIA